MWWYRGRRRNTVGYVGAWWKLIEVELREVGMTEEKDMQKRKRSDEKVSGKMGHILFFYWKRVIYLVFFGKFIFDRDPNMSTVSLNCVFRIWKNLKTESLAISISPCIVSSTTDSMQ